MTGKRRETKNGQEIDDKLATLNNKIVPIKRSGRRLYKLLFTVLDLSRIRTRIQAKYCTNCLHLLFCIGFLFDFFFRGRRWGVCLICHKIAARHLVRKLPGMIWNFTIYSLRDRVALDSTTLDSASQIIQRIRSVVIDKIKHFCFEGFGDITPPTFLSDTPPTCLFEEVFLFCYCMKSQLTKLEANVIYLLLVAFLRNK